MSHFFDDHTSETRLRLEAPGLAELFSEAALATMELVEGEPSAPGAPLESCTVRLEAPDRDALLVDWLNELIFLVETRHARIERVDFASFGEQQLEASLGLRPLVELRNPVKAASFHGLEIRQDPAGFRATIILDV